MSGVTIIDWLKSLVLEEYDKNFLYAGIDMVDQCLNMTEADLNKLNITLPGHVQRIIASLKFLKLLRGDSDCSGKGKHDSGIKFENQHNSCSSLSDVYENHDWIEEQEKGMVYGNLEPIVQKNINDEFLKSKQSLNDNVFETNTLTKITRKTPIPAPRKLSMPSSASCTNDASHLIDNINITQTMASLEISNENLCSNVIDENDLTLKHLSVNVVHPYIDSEPILHNEINNIQQNATSRAVKKDSPNDKNLKTLNTASKPVVHAKPIVNNQSETNMDDIEFEEDKINNLNCVASDALNISKNETSNVPNKQVLLIEGLTLGESSTDSPKSSTIQISSDTCHPSNLVLSDLELSFLENITNNNMKDVQAKSTKSEEIVYDNLFRGRSHDYSPSDDRTSTYSIPPPSYPPPPLILSNSNSNVGGVNNSIYNVLAPVIPPRPDVKKSLSDNSDYVNVNKFESDGAEMCIATTSSIYETVYLPSFSSSPSSNLMTENKNLSSPPAVPPKHLKYANSTLPVIPDKSLKPGALKSLNQSTPMTSPETLPKTRLAKVDEQFASSTSSASPTSTSSSTHISSPTMPPELPAIPDKSLKPGACSSIKMSNEDRQAHMKTQPFMKKKDLNIKLDLKLEGSLMKLENNLKSSVKRHFLLNEEHLSYFDIDRKNPLEAIPLRKITSVTTQAEHLPKQSFEIFFKSTEAPFILQANNDIEKEHWSLNIAKSIACVRREDIHSITSFEKAGNVYIKILPENDHWQVVWMHICRHTIYCYNQNDHFELFDSRKMKQIKFLSENETCKTGVENSDPIMIELYGSRLIVQGHTKLETMSWFKAFNNVFKDFNVSCLDQQFINADNIPLVVDKCILYVTAFGMETEGVYRLCGQNSKVSKLLELMSEDVRSMTINHSEFQVHEVTNCLKRYLRQLEDPLFTKGFYSSWIGAQTIKDKNQRMTLFKEILESLPLINYATIKFIINHLSEVAKLSEINLMGSVNIASIFGPILLSADMQSGSQDANFNSTNLEINVIKEFIENFTWLFDIKAEEKEEDKRIRDALKKMNLLNKDTVTASSADDVFQMGGMLVSVVVGGVEKGETTTFNVTPKTTVGELKDKLASKYLLNDEDQWTMFEVVCDGELERLMHRDELVMDVLLKYKDWPNEFCAGNMIQYKQTDWLINLQKFLELHKSLYSELRYAYKKTFKKYFFEFAKYNLSYRKDSKSNSTLSCWKIEDITIFIGVQKKRSPPNAFGFSFYQANSPLVNGYFGHGVCCSSQIELYKWLALLLHSQHPDAFCLNSRKSRSLSDLSSSCSMVGEDLELSTSPRNKSFKGSFKKLQKVSSSFTSSCSSSSSVQSTPTSVFYLQQQNDRQQQPPQTTTSSTISSTMTTPPTTTTMTTTANSSDTNKLSTVSKLFAKFTKQ